MTDRKLNKALNVLLLICAICSAIFVTIFAVKFWGAPHILVGAESLYWMDMGIWSLALTALVGIVVLIWLTVAFSFLAFASALSIFVALVLIFTGFSVIWPLLLFLLAVWGMARASQFD